jgi:hypothetical protein
VEDWLAAVGRRSAECASGPPGSPEVCPRVCSDEPFRRGLLVYIIRACRIAVSLSSADENFEARTLPTRCSMVNLRGQGYLPSPHALG